MTSPAPAASHACVGAQPTGRNLELISVGQTAVLRAEGGAGGCAYSIILHPDGAMFPYSGPYPRGRRCGAVGAAAAEGAVRLGRILVPLVASRRRCLPLAAPQRLHRALLTPGRGFCNTPGR